MSRFTMSTYIKTLKKAAANTNIADEEFVRLLFTPLIESGNVKDKIRRIRAELLRTEPRKPMNISKGMDLRN